MENTNAVKHNINRSFLLWWVLANFIALPALLIPYGLGYFLAAAVSIAADGASVGSVIYIIGFVVLLVSGAIVGVWFGFLQWLALRKQILWAGRWITASVAGVAVGTPLSWLAYGMLLYSPIVMRPNGIYFSFGYAYLTFGVLLGLAIGVSQWSILRQHVYGAGWWIIVLPICFTLGISFANFYLLTGILAMPIHQLTQQLTTEFPQLEISNLQVLRFFAVLSAVTALIGVGLVTGILLRRLLRFPKPQTEGQ